MLVKLSGEVVLEVLLQDAEGVDLLDSQLGVLDKVSTKIVPVHYEHPCPGAFGRAGGNEVAVDNVPLDSHWRRWVRGGLL